MRKLLQQFKIELKIEQNCENCSAVRVSHRVSLSHDKFSAFESHKKKKEKHNLFHTKLRNKFVGHLIEIKFYK